MAGFTFHFLGFFDSLVYCLTQKQYSTSFRKGPDAEDEKSLGTEKVFTAI